VTTATPAAPRNIDAYSGFQFEHHPVRGGHVRLQAAWQAVQERGPYPPPVRSLLGEALAATALLAGSIHFRGALTLQVQGDGPVHLLVAQCSGENQLRGLARWHGTPRLEPGLLGDGRMTITLDSGGDTQRYQGIVDVEGGTLREALQRYFMQSEQLQTRLWLIADELHAGGLFIQRLPESQYTGSDPDAWDRIEHLTDTLSSTELLTLPAEDLLHRLYHEESVRLFKSQPLEFRCSCSRNRIQTMLLSLGQQDVEEAMDETGGLYVDCEFCNKRYRFVRLELEQLFDSFSAAPPTASRH